MLELVPAPVKPSRSWLRKILQSKKRGLVAALAYVGEVLRRVPREFAQAFGFNLGTIATGLFYGIIVWRYWHRGDHTKLTEEWQAWLGLWKPLALTTSVVVGLIVARVAYTLQRDTNDARMKAEQAY